MTMNIEKLRQVASILCGLTLGFVSMCGLHQTLLKDGIEAGRLIFLMLTFAFAGGLVYRASWARRLAAAILLLAAVVLPGGLLNPFMASDMMAQGQHPPTVMHGLLALVPIEIGLLLMVWLLDPVRTRPQAD